MQCSCLVGWPYLLYRLIGTPKSVRVGVDLW